MNVLQQYLTDRAATPPPSPAPELVQWLNHGVDPAVRLLKFDAWVTRELATRLDWSWAGAAKEKRVQQCRVYLERLVLDLWRRGWMLDGHRLAAHLQKVLDSIGAYQRAGRVQEFWPYFRACVDRYVGANAEELRAEAMQAGVHMNQILSALTARRPAAPFLPELVAQRADEVSKARGPSLRSRLSQARRELSATEQPRLF